MVHNTYSFGKSPILIAAINLLFLCTTAFADDSSKIHFQEGSTDLNLGPAVSFSNEGLDVSLRFSYTEENDLDYLVPNSSLAYQMDPSGTMGLYEAQSPRGTSRLFKWALKEYRFLRGVRSVVDSAEEKIEHYGERMKVKGEYVFFQENSRNLAGGEKSDVEVGLNVKEKSGFKSWLFSNKFVPRTFKWRFTADPTGETVGGRFFIGEYLTLEGNAGLNDNSNMFLMFRYTF